MALMVDGHYRYRQAARVRHETWVGVIPPEHYVIPKCGTPGCICPDHLMLKDKAMFYSNMQAESMAARLIHERDRPRRYRLSLGQIYEVDGMVRGETGRRRAD